MRSSVVGALFALAGTALSHGDETPEQAEAVTVVVADDAAQANIADAVSEEAFEAQEEDPLADYVCDTSHYEISIFSQSPLVIYITNFVTPFERQHLQRITNGTFARSNVAGAEGDVVSTHRTSSSTTVGVDPVTSCISERARRFQSFDLEGGGLYSNAVFWTNLVKGEDGEMVGDDRVLHAGLPIEKGSKLGMNLWTKIDNFA
ncbi:hypothetical protein BN1708_003724 [Verticillium longisporum]|uniref:Prolyl 4-hydroxylase alpha subunit domain-containing protein n=1 Tax=Verticillium longisporum TaxID=100787 RepID=A0A0G4LPM7_VERLO|nr:hypothetical protein BN1708_003724 [Verticillium longisporum]